MSQDLYNNALIVCESYLYGNPNSEDISFVENYPDIFLFALKSKKKDVEYQFAAHKVTCQSYHNEYVSGSLDKFDYFDLLLDEKEWRAKAVSFLCRIENAIIKTKAALKSCQEYPESTNSTNEISS